MAGAVEHAGERCNSFRRDVVHDLLFGSGRGPKVHAIRTPAAQSKHFKCIDVTVIEMT